MRKLPPPPQRKKRPEGDSVKLYKRLLTYSFPYWRAFLIAILANIAYSGVDALFTYLMKPLLDKGFVKPDPHFLRWIPIVIIFLFLLRSAMDLLGSYAMAKVGRSVVMGFRVKVFERLLQLPCRFYDHTSSGQLLSLIIYNAAQISSACTNAVTQFVQSAFLAIGLIIVMFVISWQLSLMLLLCAPVVAITVKLSSKRLRNLSHGSQEAMGDISSVTEEAVENYRVVRTFGGEAYEMKKFLKVTKTSMQKEMKIVVTKAMGSSGVQLMGVVILAGMIYFATTRTGHNTLTAGGFTAIMAAMMSLLRPVKQLTELNAIIQRGLAGAETIFDVLDEPAEKDTGTLVVPRVKGEIAYKNVCFSYGKSDSHVLHNINLNVKPGESVALVGRSGSGKSTFVSLLPRFYDILSGEIVIDGKNIFDYKLTNLREQFALVSQQVSLFNDSIANNIAYGNLGRDVSEEEIVKAAEAAHAMEFIKDMPEGIHTLIGENGVLLSGGQRQRIAIARAILKNAPILILDEATSALDTESERHIQAALVEVMRNRTTLVIAHRLSTIESVDKIVVLDNGHVVEVGNHKELLALSGHYAKLHRMQFQEPQAHVAMEL